VRFDARYYNPRTGQFLSTDPAGADTNPYRYAGNDPVNASDPSGLMTRSIYGSLSASALFGGTAGLRGLVDAALAEDEEFNIGSFYSGLGSSRSTSSYSLPLLNTGARLPTSSTYDIGTSWGSGSTYGSSTSSSLLTSLSSSGTSSWLSSLGGASSAGAAYNLGLLPPLLAPQSGLAANPVFGTTSYAGNFGTAVTGNLGAMALNTIEQSVQNVLGGAQATAAQAGSLYNALSNGEYGSAAKQYAAFNLGNGSASSLLAIGPGSIPNLPNLQTILGGIASAIDPAAAGRGVQSAPFTDLGVSIVIGGVSARSNAPSRIVTAEGTANAAQYSQLKEFYRQAEDYGSAGIKQLESGRYRFYGDVKPASTPGEMAGARLVREWDPASGAKRTWMETLDQNGTVRSVAPKPPIYDQNHFIFDANGNYVGRR